jgi:hypothetical protein
VLLVAIAGCNEGNEPALARDLAAPTDLAAPSDLTPPDDLASPTCGAIVSCVFTCGLTNFSCDQSCLTGASPTALQQAAGLTICAATNCLSLSDGGVSGGDFGSLFQCLGMHCAMQISACQGLGVGPM